MVGMMAVRGLCATAMSQDESELRSVADDRAKGILDRLSWCNPVGVYQTWANQRTAEPDALLYQIYGGAVQFQLVAPTNIAAKIEGSAISYQSANLIDPGSNRYHRCAVAPS
jgi:hypothetical protein